MRLKDDVLKPAHVFLDGIGRDDEVLIIYHPDPDGVCSAVLFIKALEKASPTSINVLNQGPYVTITDETLRTVKEKKYTKIIIVDLNVENDVDSLRKLSSLCDRVLIVDHHVSTNVLKREEGNMIYINSCHLGFTNGDKYPASKLSYDILKEWEGSIENWDWVAAIGVVGDSADDFWFDFIRGVCERWMIEKDNIEMAARVIEFCRAKDYALVEKALHVLNGCNTIRDFLKSEVVKDVEDMEEEYEKVVENIRKEYEDDESELVMIKIPTRYNMKSIIANDLSKKMFPERTLVVIWEDDTYYHLSFRRQDRRVGMNVLAKNVVKRVKAGDGGGHIPAAGAKIPKRAIELEELKKIIVEEHKKIMEFMDDSNFLP